jgi:hypothetical protein
MRSIHCGCRKFMTRAMPCIHGVADFSATMPMMTPFLELTCPHICIHIQS